MKMDLNEFAAKAAQVARKREKNGKIKCDTFSMLKHCATEVVEAMEAWTDYNWRVTPFENELADVMTCCLIIAGNEKIDIEAALLRVQEKNTRRAE